MSQPPILVFTAYDLALRTIQRECNKYIQRARAQISCNTIEPHAESITICGAHLELEPDLRLTSGLAERVLRFLHVTASHFFRPIDYQLGCVHFGKAQLCSVFILSYADLARGIRITPA